jgi:hypothetical protein
MSVEHIGKGYVKICVSEEELENSIAGLSQLKPILQTQVIKGNGRNTKQGLIDAAELGKHFDTAIDAMTMLLAGFKEESEVQNEEQNNFRSRRRNKNAAYLAGNEQARAEAQQKAGKKA